MSLTADTAVGGDAEGDELNGIENLTGSSHNDQLWGDNGVNVLKGENGNDELRGLVEKTPCSVATTTTRSMAEPATTP